MTTDFSDSYSDFDDIDPGFEEQPELMSLDLDHDGFAESTAEGFDTDGDGQVDTWQFESDTNHDGLVDQTRVLQQVDLDDNGTLDTWSIASDINGDGVPDDGAVALDLNGDGVADALKPDAVGESQDIVGNPEESAEHWHQQTYKDTCAVVSQEFILEELTGQEFSEDELRQEAINSGWYTPGGGTSPDCMGNLLEAHGIDVERKQGCSFEDLGEQLEQGNRVMVAIDATEIWNPGIDDDDLLSEFVGIPQQGLNHAVQVIGIDYSNPDYPEVILNDPGSPDGQEARVPAEQFMNAWQDSGNYMVHTTGEPVHADETQVASQFPSVGYYNADGTYHYGSDNTDRDPETGKIIRQW